MWIIRELSGKYYGTVLENTESGGLIEIWGAVEQQYKPSIRELEKYNKWCAYNDVQEEFEICDNHYEDEADYDLAKYLCNALNVYEKEKK